jgi:hypothetical protein
MGEHATLALLVSTAIDTIKGLCMVHYHITGHFHLIIPQAVLTTC